MYVGRNNCGDNCVITLNRRSSGSVGGWNAFSDIVVYPLRLFHFVRYNRQATSRADWSDYYPIWE